MSRSVLLQLARDSIREVLEAETNIDKTTLLQEHPLLGEKVPITLNLYHNKELMGHFVSEHTDNSLLSNIIIGAKKAAFEDKDTKVITTSEYLHCEIELILDTPDGQISEIDPPILKDLESI